MLQAIRALLLTMCILLSLQFTHLIMATSNTTMRHITKQSQTGSLNVTMASPVTRSELNKALFDCGGMRIHSMDVYQTNLQPEAQRTISNTLWNSRHEDFSLFCEHCSQYAVLSEVAGECICDFQ